MSEHKWIKIAPFDAANDGGTIYWCANCGTLRVGDFDYTQGWYYVPGSIHPVPGEKPDQRGPEFDGPHLAPPCKKNT